MDSYMYEFVFQILLLDLLPTEPLNSIKMRFLNSLTIDRAYMTFILPTHLQHWYRTLKSE